MLPCLSHWKVLSQLFNCLNTNCMDSQMLSLQLTDLHWRTNWWCGDKSSTCLHYMKSYSDIGQLNVADKVGDVWHFSAGAQSIISCWISRDLTGLYFFFFLKFFNKVWTILSVCVWFMHCNNLDPTIRQDSPYVLSFVVSTKFTQWRQKVQPGYRSSVIQLQAAGSAHYKAYLKLKYFHPPSLITKLGT